MYCSKCGKKIDDNLKKCPKCGAAITSKESKKTTSTKTVNKKIDKDPKIKSFINSYKDLLALGILGLLDIVVSIVYFVLSYKGIVTSSGPRWLLAIFVVLILGIAIPELVFFIKSLVKTNAINQRINNNKKLYLAGLILPFAFSLVPAIIMLVIQYNPSLNTNAMSIALIVLECVDFALIICMAVCCFITSKTIKQYLINQKLI